MEKETLPRGRLEILASGCLCGSVCSAANQSRPVREALDLSGFVKRLVSARQRQPVAEAHALLQRGRDRCQKEAHAGGCSDGEEAETRVEDRTHLLWVS